MPDAQHYAEHELVDRTESIHAKAHTTVRAYERIIRNRLLPRWGNSIALGIEPLEVEQWLKDLKLEIKFANPTAQSLAQDDFPRRKVIFSTDRILLCGVSAKPEAVYLWETIIELPQVTTSLV